MKHVRWRLKTEQEQLSRCMPFEQEHIDDNCVRCSKPAKVMAYWGKAY